MSVVWYRVRAELRAGWKPTVALALLIALASGAILGALAAAHRTATAFDRMVNETEAWDLLVNPDYGTDSALRFEDVAALPQVEKAGRVDGAIIVPPHPRTIVEIETFAGGGAYVSDGRIFYDFARPNVLDGRVPDPRKPFEVFVDKHYADKAGLKVGDSIEARALTGREILQLFNAPDEAAGKALFADPHWGDIVGLRITGIGVTPDSLVVEAGFEPIPLTLTPAYWERYHQPSAGWWGAVVKLKGGQRDLAAFRREAQALVPHDTIAFQTRGSYSEKVVRGVRPYVVALLAFAGVASLLGLIVVGQSVSRRLRLDSADQTLTQALGMTRRERFGTAMALLVVPIVAGVVAGILLAWLVSPIAPIGPARWAELHPGLTFDATALVLGGLGLLLAVFVVSAIPAWRVTRVAPEAGPARRSMVAGLLASSGAPAAVVTGVGFGLEPGRRGNSLPRDPS